MARFLKKTGICVRKKTMKEKTMARTAHIVVKRSPYDKIGSLTVSEIARRCGVSTSYLCRCFRKYYKRTLQSHIDYYLKIRFIFLADSMKEPTLKNVLSRMKIDNANYFIKRFKKDISITPGEFCNRLRFARMKRAQYQQRDTNRP